MVIDKSKLTWDDYRFLAMFQVFAKAVGNFAGQAPTEKALHVGLDAVFKWWCANGIMLPGEPDFKDIAAQVAMQTASVAYEQDSIQAAVSQLKPLWLVWPCQAPPTMTSQVPDTTPPPTPRGRQPQTQPPGNRPPKPQPRPLAGFRATVRRMLGLR